MAKPSLYGMSASRAFRSIWAADEIGLDYDHVPTSFRGDAQSEEYRAINPNARIPALVDGDLHLFESMAINLYLGRKYGQHLLPGGLGGEAQAVQWSIWGISEIEPLQMQIVVQKLFTPEDKQDQAVIARAMKGLARPLGVLNSALASQPYLLGDGFTLADLNLAGVMDLLDTLQIDLSEWPNVKAWLARCYGRDSYKHAKARA